jgi:hypothetical protein
MSSVRLHSVALCFLSLTELFFRLLGSYVFLVPLVVTGLLGSAIGGPAVQPVAGAALMFGTAYVVPALLSWVVLKALRAKARLAVPLPGRHFLVLGLVGSVAGRIVWLSPALQAVPWLLASLRWLSFASLGLLIVGLALALRSLKKASVVSTEQADSAT